MRVPLPAVSRGKDLGVIAAEHRAALVKADGRLGAAHDCMARERLEYGAAK